ncbi:hypothetical protein [Klebsiella variicola]|uniref:hypothetical protein n=2 Tax=Klebsiella variicola TaxID=244366 RepID=UPI001560F6AE|nr:hypothetical protein [Klebsiella variicola]
MSKFGMSDENFNYKKYIFLMKTCRRISGDVAILYILLPALMFLVVVMFIESVPGEVKKLFFNQPLSLVNTTLTIILLAFSRSYATLIVYSVDSSLNNKESQL